MISNIVSRCHVSDSHREVLEYVISRLKKGAWAKMPLSQKVKFARMCKEAHDANRELFNTFRF